jgi:hypothetical protein
VKAVPIAQTENNKDTKTYGTQRPSAWPSG